MLSQTKPNITYYTDGLFDYNAYKLCEFKLEDDKLFSQTQKDILKQLFTTNYADNHLPDLYVREEVLKLDYKPLTGDGNAPPFVYSKLSLDEDFVYDKDKQAFENSMNRFIKQETDRGDGTVYEEKGDFFISALPLIYSRTTLEHGIWKLSLGDMRERIDHNTEPLHEKYTSFWHNIYDYYEQYIEIDTQAQVIRVLLLVSD